MEKENVKVMILKELLSHNSSVNHPHFNAIAKAYF